MSNSNYSRLSYMALRPESTENVLVGVPNQFIPFLNFESVVEYQPTPAMPVQSNRVKNLRPIPTAIPAPTGTVTLLAEPQTIGWFLAGIFGGASSGHYLLLGSASGQMDVGAAVEGQTSGATGTVAYHAPELDILILSSVTGTFDAGETIEDDSLVAKTATIQQTEDGVYGHAFTQPKNSLPTFTMEIGYKNEAYRYTGVRFNEFTFKQQDNIIVAEITFTARAEFKHAVVQEAVNTSGSPVTFTVDQTLGLYAAGITRDQIKVYRQGSGFLDIGGAADQTIVLSSVDSATTLTIPSLSVALQTGDLVMLAPQTPTYTIDREFSWIGGSRAALGATISEAVISSADDIEDFELRLMNEIEPRHAANGFNFENRFPNKNFLKGLEGSGRINRVYTDMTLLSKLRSNDQQALQVTHKGDVIPIGTNAIITYMLDLRAPNAQFDNFNPSIGEDALLDQEINFTLYDNSDTDYFMAAVLVNTTASYV